MSNWNVTHPARTRDNSRLSTQNTRIQNGVANGSLSSDQAAQLQQADSQIHGEERAMAKSNNNGGHLTAAQQQIIKSQLDQMNQDIFEDKHPSPPSLG